MMWPLSCQSIHFPSSSLLKGIFQCNGIDPSFMPALIYIPPLHLSCGVCWNEPLLIFKGQSSAQCSIWHLLAAEGVGIQCSPIAVDASQLWLVAPWCQMGKEWVLDGDLSGRGVQRTNTSLTAGECRCVHQDRGRRLAGHGTKHFLIQRSSLIGLLLMASSRKSAAAFNQHSFGFVCSFVWFWVLFCLFFFFSYWV